MHRSTRTAREPVLLSWSGGKDSSLALAALREDPSVEIVGLLTSVTRGYERISIHGVRRTLLDAQVRQIGLPLYEIVLEQSSSNEAYETAVATTLAEIRHREPQVRWIAYGDLFLEDVRRYREEQLARHGFTGLFPLWGRDTTALAREFIDRGFEARLVCVDTTQLDARFSGRAYDHALLDELPATVDRCGERGEFHTFVSAGPCFDERIAYSVGDVVLRDDRFAYCDLR